MANEIRISESIQVINGSFRDNWLPGTVLMDQATRGGGNPGMVTIGQSAEEDIAFGDVTPGLVVMQNLDSINFVTWGPKSGGAMVACGRLDPGKTARFYLKAGVTLRAIADTAACDVTIKGYNV